MISIPTDKILHVLAGAAVAGACHPFGLTMALAAVALVAIGREVYNHFAGGTVDPWDAMATGWAGALMLGWIEIARELSNLL